MILGEIIRRDHAFPSLDRRLIRHSFRSVIRVFARDWHRVLNGKSDASDEPPAVPPGGIGFVLTAKSKAIWTLVVARTWVTHCHNWLRFAPFSVARAAILVLPRVPGLCMHASAVMNDTAAHPGATRKARPAGRWDGPRAEPPPHRMGRRLRLAVRDRRAGFMSNCELSRSRSGFLHLCSLRHGAAIFS